jgi:N-acetylmuramoyl-L-alanine amidase
MIAEEISSRAGFRAVLTRSGDYDVDLYDRIRIARDHGGHCFVSVHLNSNKNGRLRGSEVYFLTVEGTQDEHAASVAERENMQLGRADDDPGVDGEIESILFDLARSGTMQESGRFAERIAAELRTVNSIPFRGVRQGNILVLRGISMPSVLLELAYLSNRSDVAEIRKREVQQRMARAVADGIVAYLLENPPEGLGREPARLAVHVVARGETLSGIAQRYRCTIEEIRDLNRLGGSSIIRPGQRLTVYANGR